MKSPQINIIGCGKLGKTIGGLLKKNNIAIINSIVNSSFESSCEAVKFIGQGTPCSSLAELAPADIYFITTSDDIIPLICEQLAKKIFLKKGTIIVHCSGSLTSDILNDVKAYGCLTASIHPLKSFANPGESVKNFNGTFCGIEGDEDAVFSLTHLFEQMGGKVFTIKKEHKLLYHAASVIACNYLVTLFSAAFDCYKESVIEPEIAQEIILSLMLDTLKNLQKFSPEEALTGPLQRGDRLTIEKHLQALVNKPLIKHIYSSLGQATLPLTGHLEKEKESFKKILTEGTS